MTERQYPERLDIPVSESALSLEIIQVELMFDEPREHFNEGNDYTIYFYTVNYNGVERSLSAYTGLYNAIQRTGAGKGAVINIARIGRDKETRWAVEYVNGPKRGEVETVDIPSGLPARTTNPVLPPGSPTYEPLDTDAVGVILTIVEEELDLYEQILTLVKVREAFADLSIDQAARLATGMMINAKRIYRPGMVVAGAEPSEEELFITFVNNSLAIHGDTLAEAVASTTAETLGKTRNDVVSLLTTFGLSSAELDEVDTDTWVRLYHICRDYFGSDKEEDEAKAEVAEQYGLEVKAPPAF